MCNAESSALPCSIPVFVFFYVLGSITALLEAFRSQRLTDEATQIAAAEAFIAVAEDGHITPAIVVQWALPAIFAALDAAGATEAVSAHLQSMVPCVTNIMGRLRSTSDCACCR